MRRHAVLLSLVLVFLPVSLQAQESGDSARIRLETGTDWTSGRVVERDSALIRFRVGLRDTTYLRQDVRDIDIWKPRAAAGVIIGDGLLGAGIWGVLASIDGGRRTVTGSVGGDAMAGGALGVFFGLIDLAISPGSWKPGQP